MKLSEVKTDENGYADWYDILRCTQNCNGGFIHSLENGVQLYGPIELVYTATLPNPPRLVFRISWLAQKNRAGRWTKKWDRLEYVANPNVTNPRIDGERICFSIPNIGNVTIIFEGDPLQIELIDGL